jgi:phosphatidylglycerol lysyltransferase
VTARDLVMRYGWNSTAYQILNPGILHWFDPGGLAVVGYVRKDGYLLAAGAPVCAPEDLRTVVGGFERFAWEQGCRVCYVCAAGRLRDLLDESPRHCVVAVGAEPVWDPERWPDIVRRRRSLRAQLHRALNKGVRIGEIAPRDAVDDPEFRCVLAEWLACRRLPPLHFMVEPEVLRGVVDDRIVLAARRGGRLIAYLVASPIAARRGYLIEEVARSPESPNGTSELLIDAAMRRFADEGSGHVVMVTMGLVALSGDHLTRNPAWLRTLMFVARAHANRFYNFRGLEHFRTKMDPCRWEPVYFISNEKRFSVAALYAIGGAFSGISPLRAIWLGVMKGVADEIRGLGRRMQLS